MHACKKQKICLPSFFGRRGFRRLYKCSVFNFKIHVYTYKKVWKDTYTTQFVIPKKVAMRGNPLLTLKYLYWPIIVLGLGHRIKQNKQNPHFHSRWKHHFKKKYQKNEWIQLSAFTTPASKQLSITRQKHTAKKTGTKEKDGSWCYMEPEHGLTIFLCLMVSWSLKHFQCLPLLLILLEDWLWLSRGQLIVIRCLFFPGTW